MNDIPRLDYLRKVELFIGKALIKVFTGQRRVGKSIVMRQVAGDSNYTTNKESTLNRRAPFKFNEFGSALTSHDERDFVEFITRSA